MDIYTIGFTKKTAEEFFESLRYDGVKQIVDVRLQNSSQLAGFTKRGDLPYFLDRLLGATYVHEPLLTPDADDFTAYRRREIEWVELGKRFRRTLAARRIESAIDWPKLLRRRTALLCSEPRSDQCHRSLIVDYLQKKGMEVRSVGL